MLLRKLAAGLRVQAYLLTVGAIGLVVTSGRGVTDAHAEVGKLGLMMSENLAPYMKNGGHRVIVNGQEFQFAAGLTDESVDKVLGDAEQYCHERSGDLEKQLGGVLAGVDLPGKPEAKELTTLRRDGTQGTTQRGDVSCFVRPTPTEENGEPSIFGRLADFAETGDMGALGSVRYIQAEKTDTSSKTRVFAIWSDAKLNIHKMFPESGVDAMGNDLAVVGRPPSSTRLFSAQVGADGDGVYIYESMRTAEEVASHYDRLLRDRDYALIDPHPDDEDMSRSYAQHNRAVFLALQEEDDGTTTVTLISMARSQ